MRRERGLALRMDGVKPGKKKRFWNRLRRDGEMPRGGGVEGEVRLSRRSQPFKPLKPRRCAVGRPGLPAGSDGEAMPRMAEPVDEPG